MILILKLIKNIKTFLAVKFFKLSLNKAVFESDKASFLNIIGFFRDFSKKDTHWLKATKSLKNRYGLFKLILTKLLKSDFSLSQAKLFKSNLSFSKLKRFAFIYPAFSCPLKPEFSNRIPIITGFYFFAQKTKAIKGPFKELLSSSRAFSIMGVLVSSVIGLIVVAGLTKMFVHMNSQISHLEKKTQQINLIGIIGETMRNSSYCNETMKPIRNNLFSGTSPIELWEIRAPDGGGGYRLIINLDSAFKASYGIEGVARFEMRCEETGSGTPCRYSSTNLPETKQWSLNLISQSQINNVRTFNRIMKTPLSITFNSTNYDDFLCSGGGSPGGGGSPSGGGGSCTGGRTWNGSICVCPQHKSWRSDLNKCIYSSCPSPLHLYYDRTLGHNNCRV